MPTHTENDATSAETPTRSAITTPKKRKTRAPGKSAKTSSARKSSTPPAPAALAAVSSSEILFKDAPNPYHPPVPPFIWIDHPEQAERLLAPVYVVRLGAGGAEQVEISIDGAGWETCRLTSGYWWYDWSAIQPGRHTLTARMRTADGQWFRTPPRSCEFRP